MTEIENLKQKLERNKEFAVIEAIEKLEQENAELKAEELAQCKAQRDSKFIIDKQAVEIEARNCQLEALATENRKTLEENIKLKKQVKMSILANYIAYQKEAEETIVELKSQIEKMKRPQNCKHSGSDYCMTNGYCVCDKWELAE